MAKFTVEIRTDNTAFDAASGGSLCDELERILNDIAFKVADGVTTDSVFDVNGNRVGKFGMDSSDDV